ncbi:MAG TPA: hypothetical protein VFH83_05150 [Spirochaetia bacterium]|nr:hypothetical protein [Spirochaetia bacterium]
MKRFAVAFALVSALSIVLAAAAFADTNSDLANAVKAVLDQSKPTGWLADAQVGEQPNQIYTDAQGLVGQPVDMLTKEMGSAQTMSDGKGGMWYYYKIDLTNSTESMYSASANAAPNHSAFEWFDVGSDGTVASDSVSFG